MTRQQLLAVPINDLPGADRDGSRRTAFMGLVAGTFKTTMVVMPVGQSSPPRDSEIEHIIFVLEGSFEFSVDDAKYQLELLDQIFVPVGVRWEYRNTSPGESTFWSITGP